MDSASPLIPTDGFEPAVFRATLAENVEFVLDAMQAISDEATGWGDEPTAVFFAGLADAMHAFARSSQLGSDSTDAVRLTRAVSLR